MWVIFNKNQNMYWNTDGKKWVKEKYSATTFNLYSKAEKEIKNVESNQGDHLFIKMFLIKNGIYN